MNKHSTCCGERGIEIQKGRKTILLKEMISINSVLTVRSTYIKQKLAVYPNPIVMRMYNSRGPQPPNSYQRSNTMNVNFFEGRTFIKIPSFKGLQGET